MRSISFLFFLFLSVQALEIQVNFGKENKEDFSVLNLVHSQPFACIEDRDVYNVVTSVTCTIPQTPINNFVPTDTAFFNLSTSIVDAQMIIKIIPKHKARLFATFLDLKQQNRIPKERPKHSKRWQVIGYISKIPFLSDKKSNGINFPIAIKTQPYVGQLDINLEPLQYHEEDDFKRLQEIKTKLEQYKYKEVIKDANDAIQTFPTSVFYKDFLFYKIQSLSHFSSKEDVDLTIASALEWIKQTPLDQKAPQVLYILANAYAKKQIKNEAYYYYKRIISEYPQNDWSALSKMQLAKNLLDYKTSGFNADLFSEAYTEAQTQEVKNKILIQWGISLLDTNKDEAKTLILKVLKEHPQCFLQDPHDTFLTLQTLLDHQAFDLASKIGEELAQSLPKSDDRLKKLIFDLGAWFAQAGDIQKAHFYNKQFLARYPESKLSAQVSARDNQLLFHNEKGLTPEERLDLLEKIIKTYPRSDEAKKAYLKKAEILFDLKRYNEILQFQEEIPNSPLVAQAKTQVILKLLADHQCSKIPEIFPKSNLDAITQEERLELFDCLYSLSYYQDAKTLIQQPKDTQDKLPWLYRASQVLYKLGDFVTSRKAGDDTLDLAKALQKPQYYDIGFTLFADLMELKLIKKAQEVFTFLQKHFSQDARMLEVWNTLLHHAQTRNDQNAIQVYARDILALEEKLSLSDYTPNIDFVLIDSLMQTKQYQEAKDHITNLLTKKLSPKERQQTLYMQGTILKALGESQYKTSFEQCLEIKDETSWRNLCQKSL